jgi:hypothetical protein
MALKTVGKSYRLLWIGIANSISINHLNTLSSSRGGLTVELHRLTIKPWEGTDPGNSLLQ